MYKCIKFIEDASKSIESYLMGLGMEKRKLYYLFSIFAVMAIICIMLHWRNNKEPGILRDTVEYSVLAISFITLILIVKFLYPF